MLIDRFQEELSPTIHFDFSFAPLLSEELIGDINGCQNGKFGRGTRPSLFGESPHLGVDIFSDLMKIGLISLALKGKPLTKDFNLNGLRHHSGFRDESFE